MNLKMQEVITAERSARPHRGLAALPIPHAANDTSHSSHLPEEDLQDAGFQEEINDVEEEVREQMPHKKKTVSLPSTKDIEETPPVSKGELSNSYRLVA